MQNKKPISCIIIYVFSLILFGYVLYVSVYNQIIAQSDGFFNMIIFAGILLLVFILISLIIKLLAYTPTNQISPVLKYFMVFVGICLVVLAVFSRIKYTTSVPAYESVIYKTCDYLEQGYLGQGNDIGPQLLYYPGNFAYALFAYPIFNIIQLDASAIVYINIFYLCVSAIFAFLLTSVISDKICGFLAFVIVLFMPGASFAVYSFGYELFFAANFLITAYFYNLLFFKKFKNNIIPIIISVFAGIFTGITIFTEPTSILFLFVFIIWMLVKKKQTIVSLIIVPVVSIIVFIVLCIIKSSLMEVEFGEIFSAVFSSFNPLYNNFKEEAIEFKEFLTNIGKYVDDLNTHIVNNYYFLTSKTGTSFSSIQAVWIQLGNQLIFMFLVIMCVAACLFLLKAIFDKVTPMFSLFIAAFIVQILGSKYSNNGLYFGFILVILSATAIQHMYLNHHPDVSEILLEMEEKGNIDSIKETKEEVSATETAIPDEYSIERARALAFYGENETLYLQIKAEEKQAKELSEVAATRIRTGFDEEGNYVSMREDIEYFDEVDTPVAVVPDVKAIPGSRPVEVVKPVFADETGYLDDDDFDINNSSDDSSDENTSYNNSSDYLDDDYSPEENTSELSDNEYEEVPVKNPFVKEGFIVRKGRRSDGPISKVNKEPVAEKNISENTDDKNIAPVNETKKEKKARLKKEKQEAKLLALMEKNKIKKVPDNDNSNEDEEKAKPGEPLHNPLPLPKTHVSKDLDFDLDVSDDDDFDY